MSETKDNFLPKLPFLTSQYDTNSIYNKKFPKDVGYLKLKNKLTKRLFPIKIVEGNINEGDLIVNKDSEVGKVLIGKKYPFALIKITSDKFDFNSTFKINNAKVKIIKPNWL